MRSDLTIGIFIIFIALTGFGCTKNESTPMPTNENSTESIESLKNGIYQADIDASSVSWSGKKAVIPPHTGKVNLDAADLVIENDQLVAGSVTINMQSITTDEKLILLEEHLKNEDFFDVQTYPTATFTLTSLAPTSLEPTTNYLVTGLMKIRDIEKELSFPINIAQSKDTIQVMGTIVIDRTDFDIRYNSSTFFENLGDKLIENNFTLTLNLTFNKM